MESFEYKGYWYLPNKPDKKIAGILSFKDGESSTLELIGDIELYDNPIYALSGPKTYDVIWGVNSEAKKITLFNCNLLNKHFNFNSDFPIKKFSVQYILVGQHISSFEDKLFDICHVEIPALTKWCFPAVIHQSIKFQDGGQKIDSMGLSIKCSKLEQAIETVNIEDLGLKLSLYPQVNILWEFCAPETRQFTTLVIETDFKETIWSFIHHVYIFEQFLSFATLSNIDVSKFTLQNKDTCKELNNGQVLYDSVLLYYNRPEINAGIRHREQFLFKYDSIKDKFSEIIRHWYLESDDIAPIRSHLIQSIQPKKLFTSIDFLIVFQAIEGYMIRFKYGDKSVKQNLKKLIEEYNDIRNLNCDKIDVDAVVDSRNYYSHFMNKSKKPRTLDGYELFCQTRRLKDLLICCMLSFIGFSHDEINKLMTKSEYSFYAPQ